MKFGIILSPTQPETVFNALRRPNDRLKHGDTAKVLLVGQGVEVEGIDDPKFPVRAPAQSLLAAGGRFLVCGTCRNARAAKGTEIRPVSTVKEPHGMTRDSDRHLTF